MMQITISSNKYETKYALKVGDDKQKVIDKLGNPNQYKDNIMYYIGEEMGPAGYQFYIENNKIVKINWNGYID